MAIFAGTEKLTFLDIKRENGSITSLIKAAEKFIHSNMRWRVEFDGSIQRKEIPEIPVDAIREAIVNSFCHRLFTLSQNNEVAIYSNRIEIYNPGTFPDGLEPENFISGEENSIKRNPVLAQLMYYSKDIESFGTGLRRITDACNEADVRVEFKKHKRGFSVVFYRLGEQFLTTKNDIDVVRSVVRNVVLNESEHEALNLIIENPYITAGEIALTLSKSSRTIQRYLSKMQDKNIIRREGSTKSGFWEVLVD
jgi:ATP-dependent DNA helicase RecG